MRLRKRSNQSHHDSHCKPDYIPPEPGDFREKKPASAIGDHTHKQSCNYMRTIYPPCQKAQYKDCEYRTIGQGTDLVDGFQYGGGNIAHVKRHYQGNATPDCGDPPGKYQLFVLTPASAMKAAHEVFHGCSTERIEHRIQ